MSLTSLASMEMILTKSHSTHLVHLSIYFVDPASPMLNLTGFTLMVQE